MQRSDICLKEVFDYSNYKKGILYFGCKVGDQDKKWAPHVCCTTCSSKLNAWVNGKGRCMPFGVPSNNSTDCYFCMVPPIQNDMSMKKNQHLFIRIYHQQFGLCLEVMDFLFLNLRTILLCTLTTKTLFLQTLKDSSHQLQEMQSTCQAQTPPIIRSQKAGSVTSSGISNFQKIRQNF